VTLILPNRFIPTSLGGRRGRDAQALRRRRAGGHISARPYSPVQTPSEISLKHSVVKIVAKKNQKRNHHVNRVIIFNLDKGIVEATPEGTEIACEIVAY